MSYYIVGSDLTEVTFVDEGTTVVLEDTGDTLKITTVAAYDSNGIQFQTSGGTNTVLLKDDGSVGIGCTPDAPLDIKSGNDLPQIKVRYDTSKKTDLLTTSNGTFRITPDARTLQVDTGDTNGGNIQFTKGGGTVSGALSWDTGDQDVTLYSEASLYLGGGGSAADVTINASGNATFAGDVDVAGDLTVSGHDIKAQDGTLCMTLNDSTGDRGGYVDFAASIRLSEDNYIGTPHGGTLIKLDGTADRVDITGGIKTTGGQIVSVRAVTGATDTIAADDYIITADTSSNTVTFTLPSATVVGQTYQIKDLGNASANNVTINAAGSDTIDGAASLTISTNYANAVLVCTASTKWSIL